MVTKTYPIESVRGQFASLQRMHNDQYVGYFDGPGGSQVADRVIDAMSAYMKKGVSNLGGSYSTAYETGDLVNKTREEAAALLGAEKEEIAFGANTTSLAFTIARTISREWIQGQGNIVVTEMDHHANVDPWVTAAQEKGLQVRSIKVDLETLTLNLEDIDELIDEDTKLVAVGLASNAIGTVNDVKGIFKRAKEVGALAAVDAVHAVPHFLVDFNDLNADFLFCSAYKFFGPHVGIVAIRRHVFEQLDVFKLQPAPNNNPDKLEYGTLNFEGLVGIREAIQFIASLGEGDSLREQLASGYEKMEHYENALAQRLRKGLSEIEGVTLYQAPDHVTKTPTVAFRVDGFETETVCRQLAEKHALHLEYDNFYAMTLINKLNVGSGGVIRAGIAPYNTIEEIDRLIKGVSSLR